MNEKQWRSEQSFVEIELLHEVFTPVRDVVDLNTHGSKKEHTDTW